MARSIDPKCKKCRREGMKLFLKGERCLTEKCAIERRSYPPGEHGRGRIKQSEYLMQLREKQKARRYYGLLENQFRTYYEKANKQGGVTGDNAMYLRQGIEATEEPDTEGHVASDRAGGVWAAGDAGRPPP